MSRDELVVRARSFASLVHPKVSFGVQADQLDVAGVVDSVTLYLTCQATQTRVIMTLNATDGSMICGQFIPPTSTRHDGEALAT